MESEGVAPVAITQTENSDDNPGGRKTPTMTSTDLSDQINPGAGAPTIVPPTIVRVDLTEGNYTNWRACVKQYLVGQGLWKVCKMKCKAPIKAQNPVAYSQWKRKNAMALHAIQISCSQMVLSQIRGAKLANEAWAFLERNAKPTLRFCPEPSGQQLPPAAVSTGELPAKNSEFSQYETLLKALEQGRWNVVEGFLEINPSAVRAKLAKSGMTPLHVAAFFGYVQIAEKLLEKLNKEDLELKDVLFDRTPLAVTASVEHKNAIEIAKALITKNSRLPNIRDGAKMLPVVIAADGCRREMTHFLYLKTDPEELSPEKEGLDGARFLIPCISAKFLDIALDIIRKYPRLILTFDKNDDLPLHVFGQMPSLFKSGSQLWFWRRWIYSCITVKLDPASDPVQLNVDDTTCCQKIKNNIEKVLQFLSGLVSFPLELLGINNIYAQKLLHAHTTMLLDISITELKKMEGNFGDFLGYRIHQAVMQAIKKGNAEYVEKLVKNIPDLIWPLDINGRNMFSIAILNRQEKVFSLLFGINNTKRMRILNHRDRFGNSIIHLAAMLPASDHLDNISGAALQMQRELQWYKEVASILPAAWQDSFNSNGKKPREVFSEQHAGLVKEGEKWMKEIATSSSFVAALIVTIMFAAAFTIPGGNNDKGAPIFLDDSLFMVFIVSDSISLFSATTSVLMFLVILTSQYAEDKFLRQLPTKLIIGLSTLFISIAAMIVTFCAALAILLKGSSTKVVIIPIALLAAIPVTLFAVMQFPLLVEIFISTYGRSIFNKKMEQWC